MRIAIDGRCIQDHFPGIGRYAFSLAKALARVEPRHQIDVLYSPGAANTRYDLTELVEQAQVTLVPVAAPVLSLRQQWEIPRLLRRLGSDVYHSPYYVMPLRAPCPMVVTLHDLIPYLFPEALPRKSLSPLFAGMARWAAKRAQHVLADSNSTRDDIVRILGVPKTRVTCVPLACDAAFRPQTETEIGHMRARLSLDQPYLLYMGINKPHKNLVRLVKAWSRLSENLRDGHQLVLAGRRDPRYDADKRAIDRYQLDRSVRLLGAVSERDLPGLYAGASAFVFPSLYEGYGLPVLEAMASGAPVVCSDRSSLPEVVGDAALLFDPENVDQMAHQISCILSRPDVAERCRLAGLQRATAFTWERTARETLAVYARVARVVR